MSKIITYELAKQLKNAGFPQKSVQSKDCLEGDFDCKDCGSHLVYNPPLSELIEACMNRDKCILELNSDTDYINFEIHYVAHEFKWETSIRTDGGEESDTCNGSTPEEAVAKLWLELNKKQNE